MLFFRDLISAYPKINNISTKTNYLTSLPVYLIDLLLKNSGWLLWELTIVLRVPLWMPFKCWVGNKHVIYCIAITFFNKSVPNFSWSIFFFWFASYSYIWKILINIFNEHGWQGTKRKILRERWYEKVNLGRLYYLYKIAFFIIIFVYLSFYLK